ncbi:MAG: hypothetical protein WB562_11310 [Candidatus Sulfotelmatobacter sp.]
MRAGRSISIWFFIGTSLLVNGFIILGAGMYELIHPPQSPPVLYQLHASVWWGAILTVLGGFYCWHFTPSKQS